MAMFWTDEKKEILIAYLRNGLDRNAISKKMNTTYDAVDSAIRRYNLSQYSAPKKPSTPKFLKAIDFEELKDENFEDAKKDAILRWQVRKTKQPKNTSKFQTALFWPDTHIPHHNEPSCKAILQLMDDVKFDKCIILGDFMDLGCIGHWDRNKHRKLELKRLKNDYIIGNSLLDEIDSRLPSNSDKHYLMGNHECLDEKTELLTKRGWVKYTNIKKEDKVLSFNPDTEKGEWVDIDQIIIKKFEGYLNHLETRTIDLMATDNHKMFTYNRRTKKYEYIQIQNLTNNRYQIPITCSFNKNRDYQISDDYLKLVAWVLTDGHLQSKYKYISIYQSKDTFYEIIKILDNLNFKYRVSTRHRNVKSICGKKLYSQLPSREIHLNSIDSKKISIYLQDNAREYPDWVSKLSNRQFDLFLETLIKGDGSIHCNGKTARMLYSGNKRFLERLQIECIQRNYSATLSTYNKNQHRLNICNRIKYSFNGKGVFKKIKYSGDVWDLTVKNHNFMIRRNNKCHFTGNCWADHLLEEMPALEGLIEPESMLHLKDRKYKISKYNELLKIGRLYVTHGIYAGMNPIKKHLDELKVNCLFAHTHTLGMRLASSAARDIAFSGYNIGCVCDLSPDYMKNRPNSWTHGFAIGYFFPNGFFDIQLIRIVQGKFIYGDKIYDGNKK
jgi:hypothetical protein